MPVDQSRKSRRPCPICLLPNQQPREYRMLNPTAFRPFIGLFVMTVLSSHVEAEPPLVRSTKSGAWSAKETWDQGRVPKAGDRVVIRAGHHVGYDVTS